MKKIIGILMIVAMVVGLFIYSVLDTSFKEAAIGFSVLILCIISLNIAVHLINSDKTICPYCRRGDE